MIDPKTLRIDNIVKVRDHGKWKTAAVVGTFPTWVIAKNQYTGVGGCYDANELHGAYLSDDWLVDNGWRPDIEKLFDNSETFVLCSPNDKTKNVSLEMTSGCVFQLKYKGVPVFDPFKTMHEFQNLFHQITGQELLTKSTLKTTLAMAANTYTSHGNE